jgi:hypothetical protein
MSAHPKFHPGEPVVYIKGPHRAKIIRQIPDGSFGRRYSIRVENRASSVSVKEHDIRHEGETFMTCWSPDCKTYHGPLGRDADGYLAFRTCVDGFQMDTRLTECCQASAKGCDGYVGCRKCYQPIDELIGCEPTAPYTNAAGRVTSTEVRGWKA